MHCSMCTPDQCSLVDGDASSGREIVVGGVLWEMKVSTWQWASGTRDRGRER